ncbi:hypothetical protein GCM10007416_21990 [Kroppenstedtia guangzhouensis]|uniref:Uncharacterized protein n=1 Tax=Kroppenstedtia guangzhouensis TaxID=1274356 RepID=A0ABQ1GQI2_9BACL|nr:hypothetical protein GCM10007416_21990 [Kroppenstedtia guangzhouensis]
MGNWKSCLPTKYRDFLDSQEDLDRPMILEHLQAGRLEPHLSQVVLHVVNGQHHSHVASTGSRRGDDGLCGVFV